MTVALHWIETDGGPSIVMPYGARGLWEGADPPETDYLAACEAARWIGLVRRAEYVALAVTRGPLAWLPQPGGGILVHWEHGASQKKVDALLIAAFPSKATASRDTSPVRWKRTRLRMPVPEGKLVAFDAAYRARDVRAPKRLLLTLPTGPHGIDEAALSAVTRGHALGSRSLQPEDTAAHGFRGVL